MEDAKKKGNLVEIVEREVKAFLEEHERMREINYSKIEELNQRISNKYPFETLASHFRRAALKEAAAIVDHTLNTWGYFKGEDSFYRIS